MPRSAPRPLRILQVVEPYLPTVTGVTLNTERHASELARRGHSVLMVAPAFPTHRERENHGNLTVERFPAFGWPSYPAFRILWPAWGRMRKVMRDFAPDIVHLQTFGPVALAARHFARRERIPTVISYRTYIPDILGYASPISVSEDSPLRPLAERVHGASESLSWALSRWIFDHVDLVISPTEAIRDLLVDHGIEGPHAIMPSGFDLERFPARTEVNTVPRLLHLGRLGFEKRVDVILHALRHAVDEDPSVKLTLAGDGPALPSLQALIAELNLANHVNVLGHVPPAETPAVYRDHDVFVTASPMETQGLVVMEAMASGLPVIGVDRLAVPEFVRNGETGFVVPPGDAQAMGEAMLTLLRNPPEIRRLAPNARCEAEKMALPGAVDRNEEIYYGVLSRRD